YYAQTHERAVGELGVKWIAVPNRNTHSAERKKKEKSRWFKKAQAWRTGCEGRISVRKRRHGLRRCLYRGLEGMKRWVGLGVMADNLINIGKALPGFTGESPTPGPPKRWTGNEVAAPLFHSLTGTGRVRIAYFATESN